MCYHDRGSVFIVATKERLSVSVDPHLVAAGRAAVAAGRSESLSAWVSAALERQSQHEARLRAMGEFIAHYEAEHGAITREEMDAARRSFRETAIVVRGGVVTKRGAADVAS